MPNEKLLDFQIVSDLHIEFKNDTVPNAKDLITPKSEILILAGDIGSLYKYEQLSQFLKQLSKMFKILLYIPGNHEYYTFDHIPHIPMCSLITRFKRLEDEIDNLYVLNQSSVIINNVCISGCTLWSDADITLPKFIIRIPDFNKYLYNKTHKSDLTYIKNMISYCKTNKLKLVVVTHHCPTNKVMEKMSCKKDKYKSLYVTDLEYLLKSEDIDTWICGHIHSNFDFKSDGGTRIVGNQKGKPKDKITDYSKDFIVTINSESITDNSDDDINILLEEYNYNQFERIVKIDSISA